MKKHFNFLAIFLITFFGLAGCGDDDDVSIPVNEIPTLIASTPAEGTVGTELAITGTNFMDGATVVVGGIPSNQVEVASSTEIFAIVPSGIAINTPLNITVRNPSGGEKTLNAAFTAVEPVLSFINSATKPSGTIGSTVILEGKAFGDIQGEGKILFSNGAGGTVEAVIASEDDWTNDFIVTTVPTGAGDGPVVVTTGTGTSNSIDFMIASAATFSPSTINWTLTTALPSARSGHNAIFAPIEDAGATNQYVYVTGGSDLTGANMNEVVYGKINADGTISSWTATASLPEARAYHSAVVATPFNSKVKGNGFAYVLGGTNPSGSAVTDVSVASINADGSLESWGAGKSLPEPLHSTGAVLFRSTIYVAGGATVGDVPVAKVYKAEVDTTGALGDWQELASLPSARAYHGFVTFGGYLYVVGGDAGTVSPSSGTASAALGEVLYAKINLRNGNLTDAGWSVNPNAMQKTRSKHVSLVAGGNMFVSSGLYAAASQGSSENIYAQINSDGTVGSFNGATGSNTLLSTGGMNLYNTTGLSYIDADGVAHVMIIGGSNVNLPSSKSDKVIYY